MGRSRTPLCLHVDVSLWVLWNRIRNKCSLTPSPIYPRQMKISLRIGPLASLLGLGMKDILSNLYSFHLLNNKEGLP